MISDVPCDENERDLHRSEVGKSEDGGLQGLIGQSQQKEV